MPRKQYLFIIEMLKINYDHSCLRSLPKDCKLRITLYNAVYLYKLHFIINCRRSGIFHGMELHRTISQNFLRINYGTEHSLVHLIHCLEHPTICSVTIATLNMSVNEISPQILFHVSAKFS